MFLRHLPPRLIAGAYILNSGLDKRGADEETAKQYHQMASTAYPQLAQMDPQQFTKLVSAAETTLGTALLLPFVPSRIAAAGLTAFSGSLVGLYLRMPGTTKEGSVAPTPDGIPLAKDSWLLGMGLGMWLDAVANGRRKRRSRRDEDE